ncbi:hypothetical protein MS2017_1986 [Bathymodiolus thermophilus thioautotrophic gill symbiont]|uniref:Restriction endonuclease n=1 Tax=Bathymodiolus thermophilus thioautotrophic gill symbiont TaxID=2360 RepID=A0A3G3IPX4_9GAMM|nr:hypothetical protein [Bathymodiolus thermophilus thioautotrophic gill symbiont]AYQ57644.1 hypothetical protein MS2017_1986 [Bathymodiolus thermophilus thioautotrophic gill symbiont]
MNENPFKENTTSHHDWEVLKDLNWHCTKCELQSGQAKTWQIWRQEKGIQLDKDESKWYKTKLCPTCGYNTVHRKLKSLKILDETKSRAGISLYLARKIKMLFDNEEAFLLRKISSNQLEIDHKFPQTRWASDEKANSSTMSANEIKERFILLNRSNNLLKSRFCEKCVKTGERGSFPGIYFWHQGNKKWQGKDKHDENGCVGCFWYDPYKWREELNKIVNK